MDGVKACILAGAVPPDFGEVVARCAAHLAAIGLAEFVREDIVACGERFELVPTVGRYASLVDPVRDEAAAREIAHQVVAAARADREQVVAALCDRHPAWSSHLRQASVALDLLGGRESERALPSSVGPPMDPGGADGAIPVGEQGSVVQTKVAQGNGALPDVDIAERRFAILDVLTIGGQGTIATAIDRASTAANDEDRIVAVKFVRARGAVEGVAADGGGPAGEAAALEAPWFSEARHAATVLHPCGIRVLWAGAVRGTLGCVVFERIVGRSLVALRAAEEPLDLDLAAAELIDLTLALAELHDRGNTHGDISAANVLVDGFGRMRLVDYGLSSPITPVRAAADVGRLAELVQWIVLGYVPPAGAPVPRRLGLAGRLLRTASVARREPREATEFAAELADCLQQVHWARGLLEVVAAASVLFALLAMLREGYL